MSKSSLGHCIVCGDACFPDNSWETPLGPLHRERSDTCKTPNDEERDADLERLAEVRRNFKRQGIVHGMDAVWLMDKLQREWEVWPPIKWEAVTCANCDGIMVCPHCTSHIFPVDGSKPTKESVWNTGKPCSCYWCRVFRGEIEDEAFESTNET